MNSLQAAQPLWEGPGSEKDLTGVPNPSCFLFLTWAAKEGSRVAHGKHPDLGPLLTLLPLAVSVRAAFFTSLASDSSSVKWGTDVGLL